MDSERFDFLAGDDDWDFDEYEQLGPARAHLRAAVDAQIRDDDPPQVWATARRLLARGIDRREVRAQLVLALSSTMMSTMEDAGPFDADAYIAALDRLPLPSAEQVEKVLAEVVSERQPIGAEDAEVLVAERLGLPDDDPLTETLVDEVEEELLEDGPLVMLPPDLLVHVPSLLADAVLTHRLTEDERESEVLRATDLSGFARAELRWDGEPVLDWVGEDDRSRWLGPRGWLAHLEAGQLLAVRVDPHGEIGFAVLDREPEVSEGLVAAVREAYDRAIEEPWLPVAAEELLVAVRVADPAAFTTPEPPLSELAAAAGLEQRDEEFAHDESVWREADRVVQTHRLLDRLGPGEDARAAVRVLRVIGDGIPDVASAREILGEIHVPDVLQVVVDELLDVEAPHVVDAFAALTERLVAAASRPPQRAVAHWLAAVADERRHRVLEAESHLREAVREDPDWPCAQTRLAWYESDRGDAAGAAARWRRLDDAQREDQDLAMVARFAKASEGPRLGRNERCWCGSGRKYKTCHLGEPSRPPLPDRVGWLCRKAGAYLEHQGPDVMATVFEHAAARAEDPEDADSLLAALDDPLVMDTVLYEGGWFERFLADREPLLPDDEAMLAHAWTLVERTVYEVTAVEPGTGITVRDLRTGEHAEVRERTFSRQTNRGALVCTRVVPDGESHQVIGGLFRVPPGRETPLLELLDERDGFALLAWVRELEAPPMMVTSDGDPLLDCRAELEVPDPAAARTELDEHYEPDGESWVRLADPDDDEDCTVLAWLRLDAGVLSVSALSESRLDEVLADLRAALPGARTTSDERRTISPDDTSPALRAPAELPADALLEIVEQMERRWCEEQVPALGGRTPREAVADPTRREEVTRLIASFPEADPGSGTVGLRPARLRELLGLGDDISS